MYIKDPPLNAAEESSNNLEKYTFGLPQKNNTYCTVKVIKLVQQNIVVMLQCQFRKFSN